MPDAYWTDARRADPRALGFEPYRGHRIYELDHPEGRLYFVDEHDVGALGWTVIGTAPDPAEARAEVDRCVDNEGSCPASRRERAANDPFARFGVSE